MIGFEVFRATHHASRGLFNALSELGAARMAPPRDTREAAHRLAGAIGTLARAHEIAVDVHGEIPRGTALIVANHVSYLDPIAILPVCPAIPFAKAEVASWPIVGSLAGALGVGFIARNDFGSRVRTLRRMHSLLAAGVPVLNFAEGTTTNGEKVVPFWRGSFGIAQRLGVPVVPVVVHYRDPELAWYGGAAFLPHYARVVSRPRIDVSLTFLPAMSPRTGEPPEDFAQRTRNAIALTLHRKRLHAGTSVSVPPSRPDPVLPAARVA